MGGLVNNASQAYYGQGGGAGALSGLMNYASGNLGGTYSSPYTQSAAGTAGGLAAGGGNPYMTAAGGSASQLQNFNGLKPQELAALQQSTANSGMSTLNTMRSQMGGGANQNALMSNLIGQNNQNTLAQGVQLGGLASQQELGAQEAAGGLYSGLSGQNIGAQEAGMQGQTALSGQNLDYMQQMIQSILGGSGQQAGLIGSGETSLGNMGNQYANMAGNSAKMAQQDSQTAMGDFSGAFNDIVGMASGNPFAGLGGPSGGADPNTDPYDNTNFNSFGQNLYTMPSGG